MTQLTNLLGKCLRDESTVCRMACCAAKVQAAMIIMQKSPEHAECFLMFSFVFLSYCQVVMVLLVSNYC